MLPASDAGNRVFRRRLMKNSGHKQGWHDPPMRVPVAISAAHVYLTPAVIEQLFCDKYRLHEHSRLAQPSQFAAQESVTLIGPKGRLSNVRVIGPPRSENQVELSATDARKL